MTPATTTSATITATPATMTPATIAGRPETSHNHTSLVFGVIVLTVGNVVQCLPRTWMVQSLCGQVHVLLISLPEDMHEKICQNRCPSVNITD